MKATAYTRVEKTLDSEPKALASGETTSKTQHSLRWPEASANGSHA